MYDNKGIGQTPLVCRQIRDLRKARGWSLAELARRAGTSAPALHRYENGWDRFELATLRKVAEALGARLDVRLLPRSRTASARSPSRRRLVPLLSPLFWDRGLSGADFDDYPEWVMARVLMFGTREQVAGARSYYGDEMLQRALRRREIDARTRNYWTLMLKAHPDAPEGPEH
jgi:transcriptional regulator with XRE-family HTH domain